MTEARSERLVKNVMDAWHGAVNKSTISAWYFTVVTCVGLLWVVGTIRYQRIFDPPATNLAAALDSLSVDPDRWLPRS